VHVVISSTIQPQAIDVQTKIAVAAKKVGAQLCCPSFGGISEDETKRIFPAKAATQKKLKAIGAIPTCMILIHNRPDKNDVQLEQRRKSVT